ncbi:hypothetical protein Taro_030185 [Colocasia esculenta]|uniref:Uncharacterized protein n=1 Tax=Colocasia esculenta TaxID=4460 RepID=A0A843VZH4_COLES|nr:hypothetical protein [Colocasia esculenta]
MSQRSARIQAQYSSVVEPEGASVDGHEGAGVDRREEDRVDTAGGRTVERLVAPPPRSRTNADLIPRKAREKTLVLSLFIVVNGSAYLLILALLLQHLKRDYSSSQDVKVTMEPNTVFFFMESGYLRVFDYSKEQLVCGGKSYYGSLLCCAWSSDGKYILTGGEDDLVQIWSMEDRKVVAWGEGHNSWVSGVAFDSFWSTPASESTEENVMYRFGSVGQIKPSLPVRCSFTHGWQSWVGWLGRTQPILTRVGSDPWIRPTPMESGRSRIG